MLRMVPAVVTFSDCASPGAPDRLVLQLRHAGQQLERVAERGGVLVLSTCAWTVTVALSSNFTPAAAD